MGELQPRGLWEGPWEQNHGTRTAVDLSVHLEETLAISRELGLKIMNRDCPGCPVVRDLPSNVGNVGSIPGRGSKMPHASEQLNPPMTTRESQQAANKDPEQSKDLRK